MGEQARLSSSGPSEDALVLPVSRMPTRLISVMSRVTQPSRLRITTRRCLNDVCAHAFWAASALRTLASIEAAVSAGTAGMGEARRGSQRVSSRTRRALIDQLTDRAGQG